MCQRALGSAIDGASLAHCAGNGHHSTASRTSWELDAAEAYYVGQMGQEIHCLLCAPDARPSLPFHADETCVWHAYVRRHVCPRHSRFVHRGVARRTLLPAKTDWSRDIRVRGVRDRFHSSGTRILGSEAWFGYGRWDPRLLARYTGTPTDLADGSTTFHECILIANRNA